MDSVHIRFAMPRKPADRTAAAKPVSRPRSPKPRSTYRHGDLRRALLDAGVALARGGGPEAVVLREATRRAGVVPNAAYRHFANREALLQAVRAEALSAVARAMEAELSAVSPKLKAAERARAGVAAVGTGYLKFALTEPGLFRTAFSKSDDLADEARQPDPARAGDSGLNPLELLCAALDDMVDAGAMPAARRPGAEFVAWSAVHGLAMLVIDGPLGPVVGPQIGKVGARLLEMVDKGL